MNIRAIIFFLTSLPIIAWPQEFWKSTDGPYGAHVRTIFADSSGKIWAGTFQGFFVSTDQGESWFKQGNYVNIPNNFVINSKGKIFVTSYWGRFDCSTDQGENWQEISLPGFYDVRCLYLDKKDRLFAATDQGVYRSLNDGTSWTLISPVVDSYAIGEDSKENLYSHRGWIYWSTDLGDTWNLPDTTTNLPNDGLTWYFAFNSQDEIFGGTYNGVIYSKDKGKTWNFKKIDTVYTFVYGISIDKMDFIYAGTSNGIYKSTDNAETWEKIDLGFKVFDAYATCIDSSGNIFAAVNHSLIVRSTNQGDSWEPLTNGLRDLSLTTIDINDDDILVGSDCGNIYFSTNRGNQWIPIYNLPSQSNITTVNWGMNKSMYVGTYEDGLFYSSNMGLSWASINNGLENKRIWCFLIASPNKYFTSVYGGTYFSTNEGNTWNKFWPGTTTIMNQNTYGDLFAGYDGVSVSENMGASWNVYNIGIKDLSIISLSVYSDTILFAGNIHAGLYRSTDKGKNWVQLKNEFYGAHGEEFPLKILDINSIGYTYAYLPFEGFLRSTDLGETWILLNTWVGNALAFDKDDYLFTVLNGVYVSNISTATSVEEEINSPDQFKLYQNYPNPFNPGTTFEFYIPQRNFVSLKVFDVIGNEIAVLVNEEKSAGKHTINFDASDLSSGVYFYRLTAGNFIQTKKMLLLK